LTAAWKIPKPRRSKGEIQETRGQARQETMKEALLMLGNDEM